MRRSEIFDSFVKIAQEKGLLSEAESAEHTEKSFSETNPRHDSLTIEQISKLYNTKPERPKDMDYERNIIEDAHPDSVVVSPSYDKLNGLVENENEGQNIRIRMVMKQPDGHLIQRKYAEKNLILSLVRVANELDNRDNDELRKLADICLLQVSKKKIHKVGWVWIAAGIAAAVGLLYLQQHKDFHSDGFVSDYQKALIEIDKLLSSKITWYGTGYTFNPEFIKTITQLKSDLGKIEDAVKKVMPIVDNVTKVRNKTQLTEELARISQDPKTAEADQAIKEFKNALSEYGPEIHKVISNFYKQDYKDSVIVNKGSMTEAVDWTEILRGGHGLMSDPFDTVRQALGTLWTDITKLSHALGEAENIKQKLESELKSSESQVNEMFKPPAAQAKPAAPDAPAPQKSTWESLEDDAKGILGGGLGDLFGN
jgi:hypothetical protein